MQTARNQRGFSLPELLVVLAVIGLLVVVAVPLVSEQVRRATVLGSVDVLRTDLRAARMIAATRQQAVPFTFELTPQNRYSYTKNDGKTRTVQLPPGVRVVSASPSTTITFQPNGSVTAASTVVIEIVLGRDTERWTVTTSVVGVPTATKTRVAS
jgi:prepilin-type N-terminal cleavage/methylation domain-containing protein